MLVSQIGGLVRSDPSKELGDCLVTPYTHPLSFLPPSPKCLRPHLPVSSTEVFYILYSLDCAHPITGLHASARRNALTKMSMPAMSPTMTEGGISAWKKAEGESFSTGDVLLEIVCALSSQTPFENASS
jgi:hypothetical protein